MPQLDLKAGTKEQFFLPVLQAPPWHTCPLQHRSKGFTGWTGIKCFFYPSLTDVFNKKGRSIFGLLPA